MLGFPEPNRAAFDRCEDMIPQKHGIRQRPDFQTIVRHSLLKAHAFLYWSSPTVGTDGGTGSRKKASPFRGRGDEEKYQRFCQAFVDYPWRLPKNVTDLFDWLPHKSFNSCVPDRTPHPTAPSKVGELRTSSAAVVGFRIWLRFSTATALWEVVNMFRAGQSEIRKTFAPGVRPDFRSWRA